MLDLAPMPQVEAVPAQGGVGPLAGPEPEQLWLFSSAEGGIDLSELRRERSAIAERKRSQNTREAYAWDWRDFSAWCAAAGRVALPATADTVSLYLIALAKRGRLPATMARRASAIGQHHLAAGLASPIDPSVREVLAGLRRQLGAAPRRAKAALSVEDLRRLLDTCGADPRGVRDRALLLLGFAGALRRSELVGLQVGDITRESGGVVLRIGRSKTDQAGVGREIGIARGRRRSTCPVRALEAWLKVRGKTAGPLFCAIVGGHVQAAGLSGRAVARVVQASARRAGLDATRLGGHSLRAGCATEAARNGAADTAIMRRTGHRSVEMVQRYIRHGSLFAADALAGVL